MKQIRKTSIDDILATAKANKEVYDQLLPDERAEVDAYNNAARLAMHKQDLEAVRALGDNPMKRLREKYRK